MYVYVIGKLPRNNNSCFQTTNNHPQFFWLFSHIILFFFWRYLLSKMTHPGKDHISDILKGKGNIIDFKSVPGVSGDGIPVRCRILTRQVGFESKGLELDLQKTAADYSFDPSEQAEKKPRDAGPDGLWRIIRRFVFCFFWCVCFFGYFTPWNFVFGPPQKSL